MGYKSIAAPRLEYRHEQALVPNSKAASLKAHERKRAIALPSQLRQRIDYSRRDNRDRRLATTRRRFGARHDMHVNGNRNISNVGRRVPIKISLLHATIFERDRALPD